MQEYYTIFFPRGKKSLLPTFKTIRIELLIIKEEEKGHEPLAVWSFRVTPE